MTALASNNSRRGCTISHYLVSFLAFSTIGLCTSEALVPSSTAFLPRSLQTRGGGEAATNSVRRVVPEPIYAVKKSPLEDDPAANGFSKSNRISNRNKKTTGLKASADATVALSSSAVIKGVDTRNSNGRTSLTGMPSAIPLNAAINDKAMQSKNGQVSEAHVDMPIPSEYIAETKLPTSVGNFQLRAYRISKGNNEHLGTEPCVIYNPDKSPFGKDGKLSEDVSIRIHDQCITSEVFGSQRCDCKDQLNMALQHIKDNGGAVIYLQQEGRGIGLANKVAAYALQDVGLDTVDANLHLGFPEDCRQYGVVPSILSDMGIGSIELMTNNPRKVGRLRALGVNVKSTVPMVVDEPNEHNRQYMKTKLERMNHANFAPLFRNGAMASKRAKSPQAVAETYINEGGEMAANAVHVSLMRDDSIQEDGVAGDEAQAGVTASEDGYCFGRQSVEDAIQAVADGKMVVVVDDMDRENEGDLIMAADLCKAEDMAEIVRYSSGVICIAMEGKRMDELGLPAMVSTNEDPKGTAFSVTVDATKEHGITTGISAVDRAQTVRLLADPNCKATDFVRPGHLFPLRAREGGVLARDGHTEAGIDLAKLAGRPPAAILCEIVSEENPVEMARLPELKRFARRHGLVLTSIVDIAQYRREMEVLEFE